MSRINIYRVLDYRFLGVSVLFFGLLITLLTVVLLTSILGIKVWAATMALTIVLGVVFTTFTEFKYGLLILLFYAYFLFFIGNFITLPIPIGVPFDLLLVIIFIASLIKSDNNTSINDKNPYSTPIGITLLIWAAFDFLEMFNPYSYSFALGISPIRFTLAFVIGYYVFYRSFSNVNFIKLFIISWLILSLIGALYGLKQEYIGLANWEWEWLKSDPRRYSLMFQWGNIRKWSFFSDVSTFGLIMAFSSISSFILMLGPFKRSYRIIAFISGILMAISMSYSGTRTATAMIPLGLGIYFLMNMNNRVTIGVGIVAVLAFVVIIYGPFYGPTFTRIRSTFNSDDPSLGFREYKRQKLQRYVLQHPLGGGLGTANLTAGKLSTTYDPDNGYLRTALDKGFPGLIIQFSMFFVVLRTAVIGFYKTKDKQRKFIYASFVGSFFAISVAQFFQDAIEQKPINFIVIAYFAIISQLRNIDEKDNLNDKKIK